MSVQTEINAFLKKINSSQTIRVSAYEAPKSPKLNSYIDHTALSASLTEKEVRTLCDEAKTHHFMAVCVNPVWVKYASSLLKGTEVKVCTVVGFPLGTHSSSVKVFETAEAIENGATEIDMVIHIGALKDKEYLTVLEDIKAVAYACKKKALLKVIIETCELTDEEVLQASVLCRLAGADYIKTSTGFGSAGATEKHIRIMRAVAGDVLGVKASGGVRDKDTALKMINAGASRIGASASVQIIA